MCFGRTFFRQPPLPLKAIFREPFALASKDWSLNGCAESNRLRGDGPNSSTQKLACGIGYLSSLTLLAIHCCSLWPIPASRPRRCAWLLRWPEAQPKNILPIAFCPLHPHLAKPPEDFEAFKACCALVVKSYGHLATIPTAFMRNRSLILSLIV